MPELPEVEVVVQGLQAYLPGKTFATIEIKKPKLTNFSPESFEKQLINQTIKQIERIGKMIVVHLSQHILVFHLKMTGQLIYENTFLGGHTLSEQQNSYTGKHTHLIFTFTDQTRMFFNDQRLFGYCHLITTAELPKYAKTYGVEPLSTDFTFEAVWKLVTKHPTMNFKSFLLNQKYIAGIGNIYADEIAFRAKAHPQRLLKDISKKKWQEVFEIIPAILKESIASKGTTFSHFLATDASKGNFKEFLQVYGRDGEPCNRCGDTLQKIRCAGRGTVFCPKCQK